MFKIVNPENHGNTSNNRNGADSVDAVSDTGGNDIRNNNLGGGDKSNADGGYGQVSFTVWKGEAANEALQAAWQVSEGDQDFVNLAKAVAIAETGNCTKGYGLEYNNCFGIKNGNTAPCPKIGRNKMCIYETPEDSYQAFIKIWSTWYKNNPPTLRDAQKWTGNDRAQTWLKHVKANL